MKNFLLTTKIVFAFTLLILLCNLHVQGKSYDHIVRGMVVDNVTGKGFPAHVTLMTADSVVVDTVTAQYDGTPQDNITFPYAAMYEFHISMVGRYIVKATMEGYEDGYMDFELRSNRENTLFVKVIRMRKTILELPEVMVKATKVKMVMAGDTIVYNADAFNLAEGSMLDALIARLPGAKLEKDGRIMVNGKYIESLLVNGRNFFSGNPKLALENLPAYTVSKIKVYDEEGSASRIMGRDMGDKSYVMDVRLKKDYSTGYMGNAESGIGTERRYMAKAFGLKMSDLEYLMAFANINNLSDRQRASFNGEWSPQEMPDGRWANQEVNFSWVRYLDGRPTPYNWITTSNTYSKTDGDIQSRQHTQTYLPNGDSFQSSQGNTISKHTGLHSDSQWHFERGNVFSMNTLDIQYAKDKGHGDSQQETFDSLKVVNQLITRNSRETDNINVNASSEGGVRIIADMLRWKVQSHYERMDVESFTLHDVHYLNGLQPRDYRNNYRDNSHQQWDLMGNVTYAFQWPTKTVEPSYDYRYRYNKTGNLLYRLDRLDGMDSLRYDLLPSTREALASVIDDGNSYRYHEYQNQHRIQLRWVGSPLSALSWELKLPLRFEHRNLYYMRLGRHDVSRKALFFEPSIKVDGTRAGFTYQLNAEIHSDIPDLTTMVEYRDDSDPLNIRLGNPNLKDIHRYDISLFLARRRNHQRMESVRLKYQRQDNAVAYSMTYDNINGIATTQPVNVDGNWNIDINIGYTHALDKAEKLTVDNQLGYNYHHSVDMTMVTGMTASLRSIVNNHHINDNIKLNYRPNDQYEFCLHAGANYYLVNSHRKDFDNIHAGDFNIGINTTSSLPWSFQLITDMTMYARRGYQQAGMNTTNWVWNAQLLRSFLKGKLLAKLQGYDILHQLSATQYAINAQGRTETWHNSLPRYVMISLFWRFHA